MELFLSKTAHKQLLKLPYKIRLRIEKEIEKLSQAPYLKSAKKLVGREGYRLRIGDYRALYWINKKAKQITILSVQHRKDAYN